MNYDIVISKDAKQDIQTIYQYISNTLLAKESAIKQFERIEKAILSLNYLPKRHKIYDESRWKNLRIMIIDNYSIFYTVCDDNQTVTIVRILYGRRNFDKLL